MNATLADRPMPPHRPPLEPRLLEELSFPWRAVEVLPEAASTNGLLALRAKEGAEPGLVLVTEHQTAGRGRLSRTWDTPPRAALTFSVLLRPEGVPEDRWPWLTLLTGVAVAEGLAAAEAPRCRLKWPNDVLCGEGKVAGLLAERVSTPSGPAVVVGVGLNVSTSRDELPVDTATSLTLAGMSEPDRSGLLRHLLEALGRRYAGWTREGGDASAGLADDYRRWCATLGKRVRVDLPSGEPLEGVARDVDDDGGLVVQSDRGLVTVTAGDVVHVRPGGGVR